MRRRSARISIPFVVALLGCAGLYGPSQTELALEERKEAFYECGRHGFPDECLIDRYRYPAFAEALRIARSEGPDALLTQDTPGYEKRNEDLDLCLVTFPPPANEPLIERKPCRREYLAWFAYAEAPARVVEALAQDGDLRQFRVGVGRTPTESAVARDRRVYDADECIGPVVAGRCHGSVLPNKAYHPTCHGQWVNGQCTGPLF